MTVKDYKTVDGKYSNKKIGILALQGDTQLHLNKLSELNLKAKLVKKPADLHNLTHLIIPGGESTALLRLAKAVGLLDAIKDFHSKGGKIFGTCAGAILSAKTVTHPQQASLDLINISIKRNGYGSQLDSRETVGQARDLLDAKTLPMTFIRAPRITATGKDVKILATYKSEPVLVEQGRVIAATFHPELSEGIAVYEYWLKD